MVAGRIARTFGALTLAGLMGAGQAGPALGQASAAPELEMADLILACQEAMSAGSGASLDRLALLPNDRLRDDETGGYAMVQGKVVQVQYGSVEAFAEPTPDLIKCFVWGYANEDYGPSEILLWSEAKALAADFADEMRGRAGFIDKSEAVAPGFAFVACGDVYSEIWSFEPTERVGVVTTITKDGATSEEGYKPSQTDALEVRFQITRAPTDRVPTCTETG